MKKGGNVDEDNENSCVVCYGEYDDSSEWIQSDKCDKWVHGQCVGITTNEQWKKYADETVKFYCPFCQ